MSKSEKEPSFWNWYWIDSGGLKAIGVFILILSPLIIGIVLDMIFPVANIFYPFFTQIGGIIILIFFSISGVWFYFDNQKEKYNRKMSENRWTQTHEEVLKSARDKIMEES